MQLSLSCWSLPQCTLHEVIGISNALGIGCIDVGLFYRSALDKAEILNAPQRAGKTLKALETKIANYYHLFGNDLSDRNMALPNAAAQNLEDFKAVLDFADAAEIPTIFILPGTINPGQSRAEAMTISIENLSKLMELAKGHQSIICFEPHVHSYCESPELAATVSKATGVKLALDYSHFVALGYRQSEIDPLCEYAGHVHLRQAKMGELQTKFAHGTLNFPAMFGALRDAGYKGAMTLESVHQDYMNTVFDDVLTEIILMRDCYLEWSNKGH